MHDWLNGLRAKQVSRHIYEINITGYGPADVGPYSKLRNYVGARSGLDCHHIVAVEHLRVTLTQYSENNAPAVAIPKFLHRCLVSPRFTAEQCFLGGRHGGTAHSSKSELLELYESVYTWHTSFRELFVIAQNVLR